jgi:hypothetical protein
MNYKKPEVAVLGEAAGVIESMPTYKPNTNVIDGSQPKLQTPAYDLDE